MRVRHDEGVANRIDPESCAAIREGYGEASTGECTGQPLSRERSQIPGADAVQIAEGNTCGRASASARPAWSKTLACADGPCTGTGRSRARPARMARSGPHREGEQL